MGWHKNLEEIATYTIQVSSDVTIRVDDCGLSSKLDDPANDYDIAALIRVQVGRGDTRCRLGLHLERERDDGDPWRMQAFKSLPWVQVGAWEAHSAQGAVGI